MTRCVLRQTGKLSRGSLPVLEIPTQRFIQRSRLHTVFECSNSLTSRTLLGRKKHGKLLWVSTAAVRHNSSQIPPESGSTEFSLTSSAPDPPTAVAQAVTEQVQTVSMTADSSTSPPVMNSFSEFVSVDPTTVVTQPVFEPVVDIAAEVLQAVVIETPLSEMGLCAFTPVGLVQGLLDVMHLHLGLSWCGAIVAGTILARFCMLPVAVKAQRETTKMNNVMPEMTKLNNKLTDAKLSGDKFQYAKAHADMRLFQKTHDVHPSFCFLLSLSQAPVFMSFFFALRSMAELPVPSMQTGGMLWFPDLTAADPYLLLPFAVTGSMVLLMQSTDFGVNNPNARTMKKVMRVLPFIILPFTINFPTAIFTYWLASNIFTYFQLALLKSPPVRQYLRIPDPVVHPPSTLPQSRGFIENFKKSLKQAEMTSQQEERERRIKNQMEFAAKGPLKETYTHNPLQQTFPATSAESAKIKTDKAKARPWKETIG
ncbi:mitochondrial inner membrane protein OXA1L [Aulostomus maculatus]